MPKPHQWLLCMVSWKTAPQHKQMPHYDVNFWHQQLVIMVTVSFFLWTALGNGAVPYPLRSIKQSLGASLYFSHNFYWKVPNNFFSLSPAHTYLTYLQHTVNTCSQHQKFFLSQWTSILRRSFSYPKQITVTGTSQLI